MAHFGDLLRRLRDKARLTQQELADKAGVSLNTIQRAEAMPDCPWRRSTSIDVFSALSRETRVAYSTEENQQYLEATKLDEIDVAVQPLIAALKPSTARVYGVTDDFREHLAHEFVQRLIEERGASNVLTALEGLAAGWNVDLPPKEKTPHRWAIVTDEITDDGHRVRTFTPAPKPSASKQPFKQKRGTA